MGDDDREYVNARQLAEFLQCSVSTVWRYRNGNGVPSPLPCIRLNSRRVLFDLAVVRSWLDDIGGFSVEE